MTVGGDLNISCMTTLVPLKYLLKEAIAVYTASNFHETHSEDFHIFPNIPLCAIKGIPVYNSKTN